MNDVVQHWKYLHYSSIAFESCLNFEARRTACLWLLENTESFDQWVLSVWILDRFPNEYIPDACCCRVHCPQVSCYAISCKTKSKQIHCGVFDEEQMHACRYNGDGEKNNESFVMVTSKFSNYCMYECYRKHVFDAARCSFFENFQTLCLNMVPHGTMPMQCLNLYRILLCNFKNFAA